MNGKIKKIFRGILAAVYKFGLRTFGGMGLQKIWPLGAIRDWFSSSLRKTKPDKIIFRGRLIYLDSNDNLELSIWGENHPALPEIRVIEENIASGDVVADVGANIGLMTIFMAGKAGPSGKVFAFEPSPGNVSLLQKNISANNLKNVEVIPKAVSDKSSKIKLFLSDFNLGDHRIYDPEKSIKELDMNGAVYDKIVSSCRGALEVEAVALDDFFRQALKLDFIKIDVQGAEALVLAGMEKILHANPNIKISMEFWPAGIKMAGSDPGLLLKNLSNMSFRFYEIGGVGSLVPVDTNSLLNSYTVANNKSTNIFCKRQRIL